MEKVIVYRSATQARTDEFIYDNPQFVLGFLVLAVVFIVSMLLTEKVLRKFSQKKYIRSDIHSFVLWGSSLTVTNIAYFLMQL